MPYITYPECGKIVNTHGCRGGVKVEPWCDSADVFAALPAVYMKKNGALVRVALRRAAVLGNRFVSAELEGVTTMEAADALRGTVLYANRADLQIPEGVLLVAEMIGLPVFDANSGERIRIFDNKYGYRKSIYLENSNLYCLGVSICLKQGDKEEISARMRENLEKRRCSQPVELPSAGSYFKRPEGDFAGRLIEECGLKGCSVGGAQVNVGGATFYDVLALEKIIKERVMSRFGIMLCREVRLIEN